METNDLDKQKLEDSEETRKVPDEISKLLTLSKNFQSTTEIDLSNRHIEEIDGSIILPSCLRSLNLSANKLREVPKIVLNLKDLEVLDVSHNKIEYFNDTPSFCHTIEYLNVSNNVLKTPPVWIWLETAKKLVKLDISFNMHIAELLQDHIDELLEYSPLLTHVILYNCNLGKYLKFLGSFRNAKELEIGGPDWSYYAANNLQELPCQGLDKCCDIQRLILTNTHIYTVTPQIKMFKNLIEVDLSQNYLNGLPVEFCELENLEICILSFNNILYIPDEIVRLKKLNKLCLAANKLCMLPENIMDLINLRVLDLYDNNISEFAAGIKSIPELDLAQNYLVEPDDEVYLEKRDKLRLHHPGRLSGRKLRIERADSERADSEFSTVSTEDDELVLRHTEDRGPSPCSRPSSPEDWDSDSYWEPHCTRYKPPTATAYWLSFAKRAMENGKLCPMDKHVVPVIEQVKYEKLCHPKVDYESEGQFDDCSEDDS